MKIRIEEIEPPPNRVWSPVTMAFLKLKPGEAIVTNATGRSAAVQYAQRNGIPVAQRKIGKNKFRVWRTGF